MRCLAVLGVLLLGGCTLDRSGLAGSVPPGSDGGTPDGAATSGMRDAASVDAAGAVDAAGIRDAGAIEGVDSGLDAADAGSDVDTGTPDAGVDAGPICVPVDEVCDPVDNDCDGSVDEGGVCGCPAVTHEGSVYLFCGASETWDDARSYCQGRGYDLAVLRTMAEERWVWDQTRTRTGDVDTWMGLGDRDVEGDYRWLDGTLAWSAGAPVGGEYNNWRGGSPDEVDGEDCVELDDGGGTWADEVCSVAAPFVCEAELP